MSVPNVRAHGELHGGRVKFLGCGRTANPTRVPLARVLSDRLLSIAGTRREELADASGERFDVHCVNCRRLRI